VLAADSQAMVLRLAQVAGLWLMHGFGGAGCGAAAEAQTDAVAVSRRP